MKKRTRAALIALAVAIGAAACGSSKPGTDGGAGSGGGGSRGGAGGSSGGAAGSTGGTGGSSAGTGGQGGGGGGGQQDAGTCRMYGQSCSDSQRCCVPMICAGGCVMPP